MRVGHEERRLSATSCEAPVGVFVQMVRTYLPKFLSALLLKACMQVSLLCRYMSGVAHSYFVCIMKV